MSLQFTKMLIRELRRPARIGKTVPGRFGVDTGSPVANTYQPPFTFTGSIEEVRVELK